MVRVTYDWNTSCGALAGMLNTQPMKERNTVWYSHLHCLMMLNHCQGDIRLKYQLWSTGWNVKYSAYEWKKETLCDILTSTAWWCSIMVRVTYNWNTSCGALAGMLNTQPMKERNTVWYSHLHCLMMFDHGQGDIRLKYQLWSTGWNVKYSAYERNTVWYSHLHCLMMFDHGQGDIRLKYQLWSTGWNVKYSAYERNTVWYSHLHCLMMFDHGQGDIRLKYQLWSTGWNVKYSAYERYSHLHCLMMFDHRQGDIRLKYQLWSTGWNVKYEWKKETLWYSHLHCLMMFDHRQGDIRLKYQLWSTGWNVKYSAYERNTVWYSHLHCLMMFDHRQGDIRLKYRTPASRIFIHEVLKQRRKEMFYLMMHSTHFIYSYMASDIKDCCKGPFR